MQDALATMQLNRLTEQWLRVNKLARGAMIGGNAADDVLSGNDADDG